MGLIGNSGARYSKRFSAKAMPPHSGRERTSAASLCPFRTIPSWESIWRSSSLNLRDPDSIPALVSAVGLGATSVYHALAAFGEPAAVAVARLVQQPDARLSVVNDGLLTLRFLVEDGGWRTLSPPALQAVRHVARQRLTGTQSVTTLWWAIDLAVASDDRELRTIVAAFAADHNEAIARGVLDLELAQRTQKRAADRLAGVPPLPPRKKPPV